MVWYLLPHLSRLVNPYVLIPTLLVVSIAAIAPFITEDEPTCREGLDSPDFECYLLENQIILDMTQWPINGEFYLCTSPDEIQLVCAVQYADDY